MHMMQLHRSLNIYECKLKTLVNLYRRGMKTLVSVKRAAFFCVCVGGGGGVVDDSTRLRSSARFTKIFNLTELH